MYYSYFVNSGRGGDDHDPNALWRDVANLTDTWLEQALDERDGSGRLETLTRAGLFGARLRTEQALLESDAWHELLSQVPHPDDTPPSTRADEARALASRLQPLLDRVDGRFSEQLQLFRATRGALPDELDMAEVDASVRLVDDVDSLSRVAVYLTWLVAAGSRQDVPEATEALQRIAALLDNFGRHGECMSLAEHRVCAIRASVSEGVLSSDGMTSIRQQRQVQSLMPHHRMARESAMCFAAARARLQWCAIDAATAGELDEEIGAPDMASPFLRALAAHARALQKARTDAAFTSSQESWDECARWSIEAARQRASTQRRAAAIASALILQPRRLAAADSGHITLGLRIRWSDLGGTRQRTADCHLHPDLQKAIVTFHSGKDLDLAVNGSLVSWLGLTATASQSRALFDLDKLRADSTPSLLMDRLAKQMATLWVDNSPWVCTEVSPTGPAK